MSRIYNILLRLIIERDNMRLLWLICFIMLQLQLQLPCWAAEPSAALNIEKNVRETTAIPHSLVGHWYNTENNATVGLIIAADASCQMYTERLTSPRAYSPCKVEFYRDNTYLIFLKGTDGQCGASADFEFQYLKAQERLDLNTGGGVNFLLEPRRESPIPVTVEKPANTRKTP